MANRSDSNLQLGQRGRSRRGIALVLALAALTIVVGMLLPLVPPALRARRQCEADEAALQAEMLRYAAFQSGILHWSPDEETIERSGTVPLGKDSIETEFSKRGAWEIVIRRLNEGDRFRIQITAKILQESTSTETRSSCEMEVDRSELESRRERLFQYPDRSQSPFTPS